MRHCAFAALVSCNTTDPPPPPPQYVRTIELSAEDASCTEAWLRVRITDGSAPPFDIRLHRDGDSVQTLRLSTPDSLLIDEGLLPNQQYTYKAYRLTDSRLPDSSTQVSVTTMDTTSHNWVFDPPVLLGDGSSSVLYDVAIINDTLAYAVGAIYKRDSLSNWDPNAYNMVKWDGNVWELMRIQSYTFCGQPGTGSYPIRAVFAFRPDEVWIASGTQVVRWNGHAQSAPQCTPVSINKLWGDSTTGELYAVGNGGGIAHRSTSGTWQRVESGTTLPIMDVFGARNGRTGEYEILCVASNVFTNQGKRLLRLEGTTATALSDSGLSWNLTSLWFQPARKYYVVGAGVHRKRVLEDTLWAAYPPGVVTMYHSSAVSGDALNNVFVVGSFLEMVHFNGVSWHHYRGEFSGSGALGSVDVRGGLMVTVGYGAGGAVAIIGRHQ